MRHIGGSGLRLVAALVLLSGGSVVVATAAVATASLTACPSKGIGGPFYRVCSSAIFAGEKGFGANAIITLPCTQSDFVTRQYVGVVSKGKPVASTTDAGYTYFSFYVPGDELEVGFEHNHNLTSGATTYYSLYLRHGEANTSFWNINKDQALACGSRVDLTAFIALSNSRKVAIEVTVHVVGSSKGSLFVFMPRPGQSALTPNEVPVSVTGQSNGQAEVGAAVGTGSIAPLTEPGWTSGCAQCAVSMITAIAQNAPGGPPTLPLQDGATFGPVTWENLWLITGSSSVRWTSARTGLKVEWKAPYARFSVPPPAGPPAYTVTSIALGCTPSTSGTDRWKCPKTTAKKPALTSSTIVSGTGSLGA